MYIDFGKRGRLSFNWKELCAVVALLIASGGTVRTEIEFSKLKSSEAKCQERLSALEKLSRVERPAPSPEKEASTHQLIAPDWTRKAN
jgi:hypothetical protein